jgi:hypothetical protein
MASGKPPNGQIQPQMLRPKTNMVAAKGIITIQKAFSEGGKVTIHEPVLGM